MNDLDRVRLCHMLDAARESLEFATGATRDTLDADRMLMKAIAMNIAIIGEAASRVSKETQVACAQIPWAAIVGMRNILIHSYFDIDLDEVWSTIRDDLPPLIAQLEQLLPSEQKGSD